MSASAAPAPSRCLVTGGAGFIGSTLADALLDSGHDVLVVDDLSHGRRDRVRGPFIELDVTDRAALDSALDDFAPQAVFHLAAQASVTASVADPRHDERVNVGGTINVLEAARRHGAALVFTSTGGAIYGDQAPMPTTEDHPPAPLSPYGASKLAAEGYIRTWAAAHGMACAICRLSNVYGPRQDPHGEAGVVAVFSLALWERRAPELYGHGRATRDYVHVDDVVRALILARDTTGTYNIASGVETDGSELFSLLAAAAGSSLEPRLAPLREGELERSCLDAEHARAALGWTPQVALADGLRSTYEAMSAAFAAI